MKIIFKAILFFFLSNISYAQQEINVTIEKAKANTSQGKSSGDIMIEYRSYKLLDIISDLTGISKDEFIISETINIKTLKVNLRAKSKDIIEKKDLTKRFLELIKNEYDTDISIKTENKKKHFFQFDYKNNSRCHNELNNGSSLSLSNNKLAGNCITLHQFKDVIKQWYKKNIYVSPQNETIKFNINISKHKSWDMFRLELAGSVGIDIIKKEIEVPVIYVN